MSNTELLLELMERKRVIVDKLHEFAQKQIELVRNSEITLLLSLLSRKQHVILEVEEVEKKLKPFRNDSSEERVWSSPEAKKRCQECIDYCQQQFHIIMEMEKTAEKELITQKDAVQDQMRHLERGATMHRSYHQLQSRPQSHAVSSLDLTSG